MQPKYFHASRALESLDSDIRPECQRLLGIVYMYVVHVELTISRSNNFIF
jgi:hypothetical protein